MLGGTGATLAIWVESDRKEGSLGVARPWWSGQIQISLVSFGVRMFPATEAKSEIHFHQINRKTGERVRHQNVSASAAEPVEKDDIVKGYEYSKGEYVQIEPEEIAHVRIPSKHTLELQQFVDLSEIEREYFEKPYFVSPENDAQAEAFGVVRKALEEMGKAGLGKIAMNGREHVMAIAAPEDKELAGLMAYELRYAEELRDAKEYFGEIKEAKIDADSLDLAKELMKRKAGHFDMSKFKDEYEVALRELVEAKMKNLPLPVEETPQPRAKVINLMDALRRSVQGSGTGDEKESAKARAARSKAGAAKVSVMKKASAKAPSKASKAKSTEKRRKSA